MPPTSMTSESPAMAPTTPSTEAIMGGRPSTRLPAAAGRLDRLCHGLRLACQGLAHGPRIRRLAADDGLDGRAIQERCLGRACPRIRPVTRALAVGDADRGCQG